MRVWHLTVLWATLGCASARRGDGLDPNTLPPAVRDDYDLFASRCSRCHSLARPLAANFDETHWRLYVNRMRAQPASGIYPTDVPGILRFLDWYAAHRRAERARSEGSGGAAAPPPALPPPPASSDAGVATEAL